MTTAPTEHKKIYDDFELVILDQGHIVVAQGLLENARSPNPPHQAALIKEKS